MAHSVDKAGKPVVTYSLREVLAGTRAEQDRGFAEIHAALAGKADRREFDVLEAVLGRVEDRLSRLEGWQREQRTAAVEHEKDATRDQQRRNWRLAVVGVCIPLLVGLATALPVLLR